MSLSRDYNYICDVSRAAFDLPCLTLVEKRPQKGTQRPLFVTAHFMHNAVLMPCASTHVLAYLGGLHYQPSLRPPLDGRPHHGQASCQG